MSCSLRYLHFWPGLTFAGLAGSAAGILILELAFCLAWLLG
jgi:hypothetical protein